MNHYQRRLRSTEVPERLALDTAWLAFLKSQQAPAELCWPLLRMLDEPPTSFAPGFSRYLPAEELQQLTDLGILQPAEDLSHANCYRFAPGFLQALESWLAAYCVALDEPSTQNQLLAKIPRVLSIRGQHYARRTHQSSGGFRPP